MELAQRRGDFTCLACSAKKNQVAFVERQTVHFVFLSCCSCLWRRYISCRGRVNAECSTNVDASEVAIGLRRRHVLFNAFNADPNH
jgi:hypothetical protein